jgi:hypothetical protein
MSNLTNIQILNELIARSIKLIDHYKSINNDTQVQREYQHYTTLQSQKNLLLNRFNSKQS